jgi:cysteine protease ATG4
VQQHYATAYSAAELKTFHCEQVRKMPMSGLDPSMLIGFLCRDEGEWLDFKRRVAELPRTIFSVQDEPPSWTMDSDDNMGLESISDPEDEEVDDVDDDDDDEDEAEEDEDDDEDGVVEIDVEVVDNDDDDDEEEEARQRRHGSDEFFDTRSRSSAEEEDGGGSRSRSRSDTEEDPVGPITPGPGARFAAMPGGGGDDDEPEDDDDWVDPSVPSPPPSRRRSPTGLVVVESIEKGDSGRKDKGKDKDKDKGRKKKAGPGLVPVVRPSVLSPSQTGSGKKKGSKTKGKGKASSRHVRSGWDDDQDELLEQEPVPEREQEHYLFPSAGTDDEADRYGSEEATPLDRSRVNTATPGVMTKGSGEDAVVVVSSGKRMNTARARDGGRTQSGGVKGVLTE